MWVNYWHWVMAMNKNNSGSMIFITCSVMFDIAGAMSVLVWSCRLSKWCSVGVLSNNN